jgi:hypothetical protein
VSIDLLAKKIRLGKTNNGKHNDKACIFGSSFIQPIEKFWQKIKFLNFFFHLSTLKRAFGADADYRLVKMLAMAGSGVAKKVIIFKTNSSTNFNFKET